LGAPAPGKPGSAGPGGGGVAAFVSGAQRRVCGGGGVPGALVAASATPARMERSGTGAARRGVRPARGGLAPRGGTSRFQEVRGPARFPDLRALPPTRRLPQAPRQPRTTNHLTAPRSRKIRAAHAAQRSKRSNKRCAYRARAAHAAQRSKRGEATPPPTPPRFGEGRPVFAFSPFPLREGGRGVRSFRPIK